MKHLAIILMLLALPSLAAAQEQPEDAGKPGDKAAEQPADGTAKTDEPTDGEAEEPEGPDIDALRKEYMRLRDKLFRSRARAAPVG